MTILILRVLIIQQYLSIITCGIFPIAMFYYQNNFDSLLDFLMSLDSGGMSGILWRATLFGVYMNEFFNNFLVLAQALEWAIMVHMIQF